MVGGTVTSRRPRRGECDHLLDEERISLGRLGDALTQTRLGAAERL